MHLLKIIWFILMIFDKIQSDDTIRSSNVTDYIQNVIAEFIYI